MGRLRKAAGAGERRSWDIKGATALFSESKGPSCGPPYVSGIHSFSSSGIDRCFPVSGMATTIYEVSPRGPDNIKGVWPEPSPFNQAPHADRERAVQPRVQGRRERDARWHNTDILLFDRFGSIEPRGRIISRGPLYEFEARFRTWAPISPT
jgi:hypothetical protein